MGQSLGVGIIGMGWMGTVHSGRGRSRTNERRHANSKVSTPAQTG